MVWIDEVSSFDANGGECSIKLQKNAHYMTNEKLRESSLIEFMAQAQALIGVCQMNAMALTTGFREAFIVSITDAEFTDLAEFNRSPDGQTLRVKIGPPRSLGAIAMFSGSVWTADDQCLLRANMKAFINT